jgi:hypothetical protein
MERSRLEELMTGRVEGQLVGQQELVIYLLANRVSSLADDELDWVRFLLIPQDGYSRIERLLSLGKALLDFRNTEDWAVWQDGNFWMLVKSLK